MGHIKKAGVYKIINNINGHFYIGSSVDIINRFSQHKASLRNNKHHSKYLQNAWNKYGEGNFSFTLIEECSRNRAEVLEKEQQYLNSLKPVYNMSPTASSTLGSKRTEETKIKIRNANKGKSPPNKGKPMSEEQKKKISDAKKGKKFSEEHIQKLRESHLGKQSRLGIPHSEETKKKLADASRGNTNWLGKNHTEESKLKMSETKLEKRKMKES